MLLVGFDDGTFRDFSLDLTNCLFEVGHYRLKIFPMTVTCLAYSQETDSLVLGGPSNELVLVRPLSQSDYSTYRSGISNEGFSEVCFSPSGRLVITGGWDGKYA